MKEILETATFGSGCFWCTEAIFKEVKGVKTVVSGYSGGEMESPTDEDVRYNETGHAESIQITFDPQTISYNDILKIFWSTHDPTTLNKQGADTGTQYRSVIFYHNEKQMETAEKIKAELDSRKIFDNPIVTEITEYKSFYPAEEYHQNFYERNISAPYCQIVINPKLNKFRKEFADKLK